jgi:hypothetical protein
LSEPAGTFPPFPNTNGSTESSTVREAHALSFTPHGPATKVNPAVLLTPMGHARTGQGAIPIEDSGWPMNRLGSWWRKALTQCGSGWSPSTLRKKSLLMRLSRPNYDKPHRCPGWSGGGWTGATGDRCEGGSIRTALANDQPQRAGYPGEHRWRFGHCTTCDIVTWPVVIRWLDPTWLKWAWWDRPRMRCGP